MSKLFTSNFKSYIIEKLISANPLFYIFLGKHTQFPVEALPPTPVDNVDDVYLSAYDESFVGKAVTSSDISYMVPRSDWVSGVGYTAYRSSLDISSNTSFYVSVPSYDGYSVFKCLGNNDTVSTVAPDVTATSAIDDVYETSDGYQWKWMYNIPQISFDKFATRDFIPVQVDTDVRNAAVDGSIDYIDVSYGGSNYDAYTNGVFQSTQVSGNTLVYTIDPKASANIGFYVGSAIKVTSGVGAGQLRIITGYTTSGSTRTIVLDKPFDTAPTTTSHYEISPHVVVTGGGTGFQGRALVDANTSNSIYKVEVVNRGSGYTYGQAIAVGNTGGTTNTAILSIVVSPKYGHGYDPIRELGSRYVCLTATFNTADITSTDKLLDVNDLRRVGVMVNPLLANVHVHYSDPSNIFTVGDTITQANTGATGTIVADYGNYLVMTNVKGSFLTGNTQYNYIRGSVGVTPTVAAVDAVYNNGSQALTANVSYVNLTTRVSITNPIGSFAMDEVVTMSGNVATSNAVVYYANSTVLWLTSIRGNIGTTVTGITTGAIATVGAVAPPDLISGSGNILYLENISPINKASGQTETKKVIIEF